jgi:hypothetical protein
VTFTARAECFLVGRPDLDETIARLKAYAGAGADCLFAPGIRRLEDVERLVRAVAPKPVNVLMGLAGASLSLRELEDLGVRRPDTIEGTAAGELCGTGRWRLSSEGDATRVRYEWRVRTGKRWMNALAPLLAPAFEWNHDQVMAAGGRGLARHLGVTLRGYARLSGQESRCTTC